MNRETTKQIIEYGQWLMASATTMEVDGIPPWVKPFNDLIYEEATLRASARRLRSIFTAIERDGLTASPAYLPAYALSVDEEGFGGDNHRQDSWVLFPVEDGNAQLECRRDLFSQFVDAGGVNVGGVDAGSIDEVNFDRFYFLMRKYASTLPDLFGKAEVSLFQHWKLIAALTQISGSTTTIPTDLALVGGDIPGIQRTISMVTSKGAAKAMRGRSAFIQLLGRRTGPTLAGRTGTGIGKRHLRRRRKFSAADEMA